MIYKYNANLSSKGKLSILRKRNIDINYLRNKSDSLIGHIRGNIDILMVSETKLDESFPIGQFIIEGFGVTYKVDRNANGGRIILFLRENIPTKLLYRKFSNKGLNLRKKEWLLSCSYTPNRENIENHLQTLSKSFALYSSTINYKMFETDSSFDEK